MTADADRLGELLTPRLTKYIPHVPTAKQQAGLLLPQREVLYGGAAGGGKSDWLLMGGLQYADVPGYAALLLRRTFKELELEGGLLERAWDWLSATDAEPHDGGMKWTFGEEGERGAVLQFGYLDGPHDHTRYQGSEWQYIGCDEGTNLRMKQYRYMFSRLRRPRVTDDTPEEIAEIRRRLGQIPLRMRVASNPGGISHDDFKLRFGIYWDDEDDPDLVPRHCHRPEWVRENNRAFLPATIADNPHLDQDEYRQSLAELDPLTRRQLELGDWDAKEPGEMFRREWFEVVDRAPAGVRWVRYWDLAATEPSAKNDDPDYTAGLKLGRHPNGEWFVADVRRGQWRSERVEAVGKAAASEDGAAVPVGMEQEPGASGKSLVRHWQRDVLPSYEVRGYPSSDSKAVRARPVASKAEAGLVKIVRGPWVSAFLDEAESFPPEKEGEGHDDQIDALSGAFVMLEQGLGGVTTEGTMDTSTEQVRRTGDLTLKGAQYVDKP